MPTSRLYRGWRFAPLRFVVWVLAALYLGRVHYNNTLFDLRQLSGFDVVVKTASIAAVAGFVYWNLELARPDIIGMIWAVVVVFVAKVLLIYGVIRLGTIVTDRRDLRDRRRFEQRTSDD